MGEDMGKKQSKTIKKPAAIKDESATVADSCRNGECCILLEVHSVMALKHVKVLAHARKLVSINIPSFMMTHT